MNILRSLNKTGWSFGRNFLSLSSAKLSSKSDRLVVTEFNDEGVATIAFNRPPMSSFTLELLQDFSETLDLVNNKKDYKGLILTSTSPKAFSAGLDIKELIKYDTNGLRMLRGVYLDCCTKLYSSFLPSAALINGHAIGGGCFFGMLTEYRVMLKDFKIGLNETQLGIAMPEVAVEVTKNTISSRNTELALTMGTIFSTEEAFKIGLIDEIANNTSEAHQKCVQFLRKFEIIPPKARAITKNIFRKKVIDLLESDRERDIEAFVAFAQSPATQKMLSAFFFKSTEKVKL